MVSYNNNSYTLFVCHTCKERKGIAVKAAVTASAKEKALNAVYNSAMQILEPILVDQLEKKGGGVQLPNPNLVYSNVQLDIFNNPRNNHNYPENKINHSYDTRNKHTY
jgi:hypothetical protein